MTKAEIVAALESFKDAVGEDRRSRISELQAAVGALLDVPILEEVEALKKREPLEMPKAAEEPVLDPMEEELAEPVAEEKPEDSDDEKKTLKAEVTEPKKRKPYTYKSKFVPKNRVKSKKR